MARRREATRKLREIRPVVIGAGVTEKWYFRHMRSLRGYAVELQPKYFGTDSAYDMQKMVENVLSMGGKAICVFDMDTTQWNETKKERKERFMERYADAEDVILCGSMPSVEYWFLLHFERTNRYFGTSEKVIESLTHYMPFEKTERFLSKPMWVQRLLAEGGLDKAMGNAASLGESGASYTQMPRAIAYLEEGRK